MPWYSSGSTPFNAMQWANQISQLGEQMEEKQKATNLKAKAADTAIKADPSLLNQLQMNEEQWKALGSDAKIGSWEGLQQKQGYQKGLSEMAKAQALTQQIQQQTQLASITAGREQQMPAFIGGMLGAQGQNGDPANDIPAGMGPATQASPEDMIKGGMAAAPGAMDDRMFGNVLHYILNDRANKTSEDFPATLRSLSPNLSVVEKRGSKEFQIVSNPNAEPAVVDLPNGSSGIMNPKTGAVRVLPIPKTDWHDLSTQQKAEMDAAYKSLENDSIYNAKAFGATPEERQKNVETRREDLNHHWQGIADKNREAVKALNKNLKAAPAADIPEIKSDDDYAKLPSGAKFKSPDGKTRIKP